MSDFIRKPGVLYVDGDAEATKVFRDAMKPLPVHLALSRTATDAARRIATEPFRVVFAEHQLPDSSGLALLAGTRAMYPGTQVILYTASKDWVQLGTDVPVLFKPAPPTTLRDLVMFAIKLAP